MVADTFTRADGVIENAASIAVLLAVEADTALISVFTVRRCRWVGGGARVVRWVAKATPPGLHAESARRSRSGSGGAIFRERGRHLVIATPVKHSAPPVSANGAGTSPMTSQDITTTSAGTA